MSGELLPCPFCGGESIELRDNGIGDTYAIRYSNDPSEIACGARTSDAGCETDDGAIRRWNRRALLPKEGQGLSSSNASPSPLAAAQRSSEAGVELSGAVTPEFIAASAKAAIRALRGLEPTAIMLERYAEECFPILPEHQGKVHFARAIMESAAEAIRESWASAIKEVETLP